MRLRRHGPSQACRTPSEPLKKCHGGDALSARHGGIDERQRDVSSPEGLGFKVDAPSTGPGFGRLQGRLNRPRRSSPVSIVGMLQVNGDSTGHAPLVLPFNFSHPESPLRAPLRPHRVVVRRSPAQGQPASRGRRAVQFRWRSAPAIEAPDSVFLSNRDTYLMPRREQECCTVPVLVSAPRDLPLFVDSGRGDKVPGRIIQ